jgi:GNAT superfamily N-acetyltransferase
MSGIRLRPATADDAEAIARLLRDTLVKALPFLPVLHTPEEDRAFVAGHVLKTGTVWLAETERVVGFIAFREGWIDHLYVDVGHHGRGIGSALLAKAFAASAELQLWAFRKNRTALAFYARKGFRVVEETDGSGNEEKEPDVRLHWRRDGDQPS